MTVQQSHILRWCCWNFGFECLLNPINKHFHQNPCYWHNMIYFLTLFAQYLTLLNYSSLRMRTIRTLLLSHVKKLVYFCNIFAKVIFCYFFDTTNDGPLPLDIQAKKKFSPFRTIFPPKGKSNTPFWTFFYVRRLPFFLSKTRLANIHFYLRFLFLDLEWETYCLITCIDKTV